MAKFNSKNLYLKDGQTVTFGTDLDTNLWWDGSANDLRLDHTISGIDPTQSYHLTTRWYVDNEISALSSGIVLDHGGLTGLGDDDHTQYILVDGTRAFTGTVGGITPTAPNHLTTKDYVDSLIQGLDWQDSVLSFSTSASGVAVAGNRYIALDTAGDWTEDYVMEYTGTSWSGILPNEGYAAWVENEDALYVYNGSDWVKFGSTVSHNNTSGLQGGTVNEYYHLTSAQYTDLTDVGGVGNASNQHVHDDRYYTETEIDTTLSGYSLTGHSHVASDITDFNEAAQDAVGNIISGAGFVNVNYDDLLNTITISGVVGNIDHGGLSGLSDDDHTQYILTNGSRGFTSTVSGIDPVQDYHLATKYYIDTAVSTLSGTIPYAHDQLLGLGDDDHTQYILVDGSRGFTATVSGVTPTQPYHLATKEYVDAGSTDRKGRQSISNGASVVTVSFADIGHTNYTVSATLANTADSPPSIYAFIVSAITSSSFTVSFIGDMDSANYVLHWSILED